VQKNKPFGIAIMPKKSLRDKIRALLLRLGTAWMLAALRASWR
jgi:hypothetical protein